MKKLILTTLFRKSLGIIIFLLAVLIANYLTTIFPDPIFLQIMSIINANLLIIIVIALFYLVKDMLEILPFPFNLLYPIANVIASVILIYFIFELLLLINIMPALTSTLLLVKYVLYVLVGIIVLIVGYWDIFSKREKFKKIKVKQKKKLHKAN
jgi:hypothetical protein